jgi:MFS family permease
MEARITHGSAQVTFLLPLHSLPYTGELGMSILDFVDTSDLFGRKPILYSSIVIFIIGSALCGAAQSTALYNLSLL